MSAREAKQLSPRKTYANADNARKAVTEATPDDCHVLYHIAYTAEGRAYPICFGQGAIDAQMFQRGFITIS